MLKKIIPVITSGYFSILIDKSFDQYHDYISISSIDSMSCKQGFIHNYAWFEILSKTMCIHCGIEQA
jgi:hypothetical protein